MKTYLVPVSDELAEVILNKPNNILRDSTCLSSLTNGEVMQKAFPDATITKKNEYVVFLEIDRYGEPKLFDKTWWNAKWGE